jgi:hypothetical protein
VVGLLVQLVPLLIFPIVLSQDGAAHVDGAWVLTHHGDAGPLGAVLRRQYRIDLAPVPNMFTTLVLAALVRLLSADAAERWLVAAFAVALVAAVGYAARAVDRRAGWLAAAALPLVGGQLAAYGFYNFCWGVVGAVLVLGMALRRRAGWSVPAAVVLAVVLTLTWSAHLLPYGIALLGVALLAAARTRAQVRSGETTLPPALRRHVLPVALAALPSLALTGRYAAAGSGTVGGPDGWPSPARPASLVTGFRPLVVDSWLELAPAIVVMATLAYLGLRATGRWRWRRADVSEGTAPERVAIAVLLACCAAGYLLAPNQLGDNFGFLPERLAWFPLLVLVLWSATRPAARRVRLVATVLLVVAASAAMVIRLPAQAAAADDAQELLSVAGAIGPGSDFVVLRYSRSARGPLPIAAHSAPDYLRHESSRLAIRAGSADAGLYEAETPYFQVSFAGGPQVWRRLAPAPSDLEAQPPAVDLAAARGLLDDVVVVGLDRAPPAVRHAPDTQAVLRELTANYQLVKVSSPTGLASVWRFRAASPG